MIPDKRLHPKLHQKVMQHMIHKPCLGSNFQCITSEGTCKKKFPKKFINETHFGKDSFAQYRRVDNRDENIGVEGVSSTKVPIDNSWVVPYSPFLMSVFDCHLNVEVCSSISAVKYIYKYCYKGFDSVSLKVSERPLGGAGGPESARVVDYDEIQSYVDGRYLSSIEAAWRLMGFPMQARSHAVERLPLHLPNMQNVVFNNEEEKKALEKSIRQGTRLTNYFRLCSTDPEARKILYKDIPKYYYYRNHRWVRRVGHNSKRCVGRMLVTSSNDRELSSLRSLLLHVAGPMSFDELRTHNGIIYSTFYEAAKARGVVESIEHFRETITEASVWGMPGQLRELFVDTALFDKVYSAAEVYEELKDMLCEDFFFSCQDRQTAHNRCLTQIKKLLGEQGKCLADIGLDSVEFQEVGEDIPMEVTMDMVSEARDNCAKLNGQQKRAVQLILVSVQRYVSEKQGKSVSFSDIIDIPDDIRSMRTTNCFFLDGPAGTGKTFVYNTVISVLRCRGLNYICVAPTGLAASLLDGGKTVHSKFKLSFNTTNVTVANISTQSEDANNFRKSSILIWDEISMCSKYMLNAVSRFYQDLLDDKSCPFGGAVVVCGGDFRQQPPVIKRGKKADVLSLCVKKSNIWHKFLPIRLTENMRARESEKSFCEWLLKIGNGDEGVWAEIGADKLLDSSKVPEGCSPFDALIESVFGMDSTNLGYIDHEKLASSAILCARNEHTHLINEEILSRLPGEMSVSHSVDSAVGVDDSPVEYPPEFLHGLYPSGMPPHELKLKVGCVVMLLRNTNASRGLCNGTRLIVQRVGQKVLECSLLNGVNKGQRVFIPKVKLEPSDLELGFRFFRYQFPVRLSYSMTIHKAQGQSMERVVVYLGNDVFTHGQLYTALSRVKNGNNLKIDTCGRHDFDDAGRFFIRNIVYRELLQA